MPAPSTDRRAQRLAIIVGVLVVALVLILACLYVVWERREARRALTEVGELPLIADALGERVQVMPTRTGAVIGGASEIGTTVVRVDHQGQVTNPISIPRGGLDRTFVDGDGGLWSGENSITYQPASGKGWTAHLDSYRLVQLIGSDGDTALVAVDGCGPKPTKRCEAVLGVRDGRVAWRTPVDAVARVPDSVAGTIDPDPELLAAPRFAVAAVDGRLVTIHRTGAVEPTGSTAYLQNNTLAATIVGDQILTDAGNREGCALRSVTVHRWTAQVPCGASGAVSQHQPSSDSAIRPECCPSWATSPAST